VAKDLVITISLMEVDPKGASPDLEAYGRQLDELEESLAEVERALRRLDEGSYGRCEVCDRPSGWEKEEAVTTGLRCAEHR
jgi:DnaK suppressor protein